VSFLTSLTGRYLEDSMTQYSAKIAWTRGDATFIDKRYSRLHTWEFDGGAVVRGSSAPTSVPVPYSDPTAVDPEEAFVASLASCHMLWFLSIAAKHGFCVQSYGDDAVGTLAAGSDGKLRMTAVNLRPHVVFVGEKTPTAEQVEAMHAEAHRECFIANSVTTTLTTTSTFEAAASSTVA
jgi:organic hydroperoxide reductase OsmC/OhrA